jgi:hypothetical protein
MAATLGMDWTLEQNQLVKMNVPVSLPRILSLSKSISNPGDREVGRGVGEEGWGVGDTVKCRVNNSMSRTPPSHVDEPHRMSLIDGASIPNIIYILQ